MTVAFLKSDLKPDGGATVLPKNNSSKKQRYRNFAPKVKTGCLLCKSRKVKCDERKPSCKR